MSSRKSKRGQKLGSSRRNKNHNQETEEKDNDDGYQDPGKEEHESECQFLTVSENQSSNKSSLLHPDQPVVVCTSPSSSVLEFSPQPQSQEFNVVLGQADITSKKRKMGSTRKGNRNFKFEEISEDEPEHRVQLSEGFSDEHKVDEEASIKEYGGKEDQTSLMDCLHSQSSESLSSVLQGKHFGPDTIMQNEDDSKNDKYQHLEAAVKSKPTDIFSSEPNQPKEAEFSQDLKHDQSSLNVMVNDTLEGSHAEDIVQDKVTGVQSASLIYEHEHMTEDDKMSTVKWENVNSKASTEDEKTVEHSLEHKDKPLQLTEESIYKSESTEVREDTDEYKEVSAAWDRTDNDSYEGLTETNLNQTMVPDTNIISHLKMKDQELGTSSEQILSDEFQFQGDSEIICYREEKNDLSEARCWTGKSSADEKKGNAKNEVDMHYNEEKYRATRTEGEVEYDDMQSANSNQLLISKVSSTNRFDSVTESELIPAKTLYGATESNSKTCNLQHNNPKEFPTELEMQSKEGDCSDQMPEKVDKDRSEFSDTETEVAGEENNDIKEEINAISTESFTKDDFKRVDDEKDGMSTFMNELEMASVMTNIQDYVITGQASIVIEDHGIESPDKGGTCPYLDSVELIHETQVKLDMPVYNPIPDQKQNMYDECQVYPTNAEQFESTFPIVYMQESRQVQDNSASENVRFSPSKKNKIDSFQRNLSGQISVGDQNAMEETIQVQSLEESTPVSGDETLNFTAESCYHHSPNMIEPEAKKIDENVIKAEHLVDTEVLKMQSRTEVAESIIRNEETTWEGDKHDQPISLEDPRQNTYPDLKLEQSKTSECTELVTDRLNTDHTVTFAEPVDTAELEQVLGEKILQATPTPIPSTNSHRRKMGSIRRTLGEKKKEKDKEEDMYVEEKDTAFTKRSMLLGPETGASEENDNDRNKEINAGHRENFTTEAKYTQQYMYSEIPSQTVLSFQTAIKNPSSPTEHTDFQKDDKNNIENLESKNAEIQMQTQTKKKKKIGSTRRPHGRHQLQAEGEEGEWKELENAEEIEHQLITQVATSNLINEPQKTMSEVTPNIHDSTVTTEQIQIITTEGQTGTGGIDAPPGIQVISDMQMNTENIHTVVPDQDQNITQQQLENLNDWESEQEQPESTNPLLQVQESQSSQVEVIKENENTEEQKMDQNRTSTWFIEEHNNDTKEEIKAGPTDNFTKEDITSVCSQQYVLCELTSQTSDLGLTTIEYPSPATEHLDFKEDEANSIENVESRSAEIQPQTQTRKKKKMGSTRRPHGRHQPPQEGEEGEWKELENAEEIEHQLITQVATSNLINEPQNTMSEVTPNIHDSTVTTEQIEIITTEGQTGTGGIDAILSIEVDQINTVASHEVGTAEGLTDTIEQKEKSAVHEVKDSVVMHLDEQEMAPVVTKTQDDALIEHVSLTVRMQDNEIPDNECASRANVHSTCENVDNSNAEILMQTQPKTKKKIGSTRRPRGRHQPPPEGEEGEWKELENAEEIEHQLITQVATSNLINEPQNTMSEVTPNIHGSTVTTEQIEIITTEGQTGTGGIDAILSIEVDQINTVASHEVGTAGGIDAPPGIQVISDMQMNTENIHTVVPDQDQNITQQQLENLTDWESEQEQPESTNPLLQVQESQSSQVEVIKENENTEEQKMDQNRTSTWFIEEHNNDTKEEIKAGPTDNFTKEDITSVCSQQYVLCELTSQTSDLGLTTIEYPSPATEHLDFKEDEANSIENVESRSAEIQPQTQTRKKKKMGSTRRPHGRHQPPPEGEEGEWKELENAEEIEHQLITQVATSNLINEPQNTMSEVTPNIHGSTVTTEQIEIITTEGQTGTGGIDAILSIEVDQINTVASHEVGTAEGLTDTIEQKEKSAVHEVKDSVVMHLDEQEMAPVVTKIQDDALIEHVSLTVKMHDNEIPDNECASRANVHSTCENVDNSNAEILTQTQPKTKKKIGSTRRPRGRHQPPPEGEEGEWKELENAEEIEHQLITQVATSNLINEPQNTMSEVTPNIHGSTVTTEQIEIITTEGQTGTGGIDAILSIEVDQINTVASHEVGTAEGLTDTIEQKEKSAVHEVKDSVVMHLDEQEMAPVVTKIQDDALIEHVSLTVKMHDNEIPDNECASRANVHSTCENVDNSNAEILTQTQPKTKKKIGSTRRPRGRHQPPPEGEEGEWKELENAEEIEHQLITQVATSNLINEPQNTMSEVTPNIHGSTVTTEQIEIITTEGQTGTGGIDAILSIEVDQINTVASHEVDTARGINAPPGIQVISDMQMNTENIHTVVPDQDQNITQQQLENLTDWESEQEQPESTNPLLQVQESQSSQVEVIKENENRQEQKMDQNRTSTWFIEEHNNDTKEEIKAGPTDNFTKEDITNVCSQQYVLCELTSQTSDLGLTTIEYPSPATEHLDFKEDEANSIENVESRSAEIQPQTQTRKKKKMGSTRRPHGRHQPPPEGEEGEWKELENAEEIEHQLITQVATSNLINEPQNTMSEVTPNIHGSTVTTEQIEIITTEGQTGTGGIDAILSIEVDQINTVASHEVGTAEGLTDTIEQKEKSAVHEVKDSVVMHLDEQEMAPVVTKIQDDALIEHVSLTVKMHDNEIPDNECASRANVHSTCENVDNSNAEILTQTQPKTKKKIGSTRRPRGRHQPPPEGEEGEWKELENAEEIEHQLITQVATSNLINEPQNTMSEVTPNIHGSTVTTEQIEIITTEGKTGTGGIDAILSIEVDQINTVASPEVGTAGGIDAPPGIQVISDMQLNTENIHRVLSDQDQNITQQQLENLTDWESEQEQPESTNPLLQVQESQSSQVEVIKENENRQEQKMDQNRTSTWFIEEHNNDTKEEIKAGPTDNFTKEDITSVCSQKYVLCELTSQTSDLGLTTIEYPSPATEHLDFKEDEANSIENVESRSVEIQPQTQTRKKKKMGSTRRPHGRHQPPPEGEEGEWKELENAEEIEHQLITQVATSNLINEPQNTMSEVTPNIHGSTVTTEQIEIITTEGQTGTGGIDAILSIEVDQINTVASHEVGTAEGLTDTIEQKEKSAVHEVKDSVVLHLDEQEMAPVVTKIQDDALIEHVSLTVRMHDNEIPDNECASRANVHSTCENVDNSNAEIQPQTQIRKKKKIGSTRRPRGRHQPPPEGEEGEWKELENAEEIEHQLITQVATSNLINEPQNTMSEVTPNIHDSTVTTEQIEIITTEGQTGTGGIEAILSIEVDQINTVASHEVGNPEGLTDTIEQKEKSAVHEVKDSVVMHLDEQEMAPVVTKIQDDALIEHVSLTVRMHDNEIPDNECASRANVHSTCENVDNSNAEIQTQRQHKKKKKFGSTRRPHGGHQPPPEGEEGEWKDLENTEEIQCIDHAASSNLLSELQNAITESLDTHCTTQLIPETQASLDMPVVSEQYHTMFEESLENPKNNESEKEQCDITCPVVHIQELNLAPHYMAKQSSGDSNSGRRKKIGSTRRSLRVIKEKENIQEQTRGESTPKSAKDNAQNGAYHLTAEISHQSIQTHSDPLNIIEHEAEEMGSICKNLEEGQSKQEAWQSSTDMSPRYVGDYDKKYLKLVSNEDMVNPESSSCNKKASVPEYKTKIHHKLDHSEGSLLSEIELYLNKSFENTLNTTVLNPNISEFSEPMFEGSLQLPSSQNPQIHMEQSSPARKRKMGSSRKMPRNKHEEKTPNESEGSEQEKENLDKNRVKNSDPKTEAKLVEETVMAEGTEDMKESAELMSEVQALSETNESSTQVTEQPLPEGRRKFGSRRTTKGCSGLGAFTHGDYESNQENTDIQMTKDLRVSDPCFISEPKSPPISHQVSEARPGTEEVTKVKNTNISHEAGLVSLDSNRKTSPSVVSTGIRQKIDFEQWNEQIPDFGELVYNIVMVGNSSVGKTSFIKRLQSGHFIPDYSSTIGVDTFVHTVTFGNKTVKLYVWDTAGQERYHSITRQVFHKAQGLLLMYDITSSQSFHAVRAWISQIQENAHPDVILMLLGNKNDCADREVQLQEGETLSKEYDIHFMECSVATGENVSESLKTLAWLLMKQRVRKEEEHKTLQPKPQQNKKSGCC
ncbi:titin homolog isoform X1 [Tachysurus vachellii]|uniref:titin homolog isoform X1 n=1 Tax=Tachysurus vachellii TaxID=175792 RepID=UPI00296B3E12|nr:titin homolog isoform X1 [Tachysurus vachellii]